MGKVSYNKETGEVTIEGTYLVGDVLKELQDIRSIDNAARFATQAVLFLSGKIKDEPLAKERLRVIKSIVDLMLE